MKLLGARIPYPLLASDLPGNPKLYSSISRWNNRITHWSQPLILTSTRTFQVPHFCDWNPVGNRSKFGKVSETISHMKGYPTLSLGYVFSGGDFFTDFTVGFITIKNHNHLEPGLCLVMSKWAAWISMFPSKWSKQMSNVWSGMVRTNQFCLPLNPSPVASVLWKVARFLVGGPVEVWNVQRIYTFRCLRTKPGVTNGGGWLVNLPPSEIRV